jgi:hypothetical protein
MRTRQRRPFSQSLVIGLAALMALTLAYLSFERLRGGPARAVAERPKEAAAPAPKPAEPPKALEVSESYSPVSSIPPAAGRKFGARGLRKSAAPPPPR